MEFLLSIITTVLFFYSIFTFIKFFRTKNKSFLKKGLALLISSFITVSLIPPTPENSNEHPVTIKSTENSIEKTQSESVDYDASSESTDSDEKSDLYFVERVVDGDTIIVNFNGKSERVRLIGVDTPESVHPDASKNEEFGKVASDFTKSHLEGKEVFLEFDVEERDRYGRLLAYVWVNDVMFNKTLLEEGMAQVATFPPNVKYVDDFTEIEKKAREKESGLWGVVSETSQTEANIAAEKQPANQQKIEVSYIGNKNSKIFHYSSCSSVNQMSDSNKVTLDSREIAINNDYTPCKKCKP